MYYYHHCEAPVISSWQVIFDWFTTDICIYLKIYLNCLNFPTTPQNRTHAQACAHIKLRKYISIIYIKFISDCQKIILPLINPFLSITYTSSTYSV